jgi:transcription elongation factor GreA
VSGTSGDGDRAEGIGVGEGDGVGGSDGVDEGDEVAVGDGEAAGGDGEAAGVDGEAAGLALASVPGVAEAGSTGNDGLSPGAAAAIGPVGSVGMARRPNHTAPTTIAMAMTNSDRARGRLSADGRRTVARTIPRARRGYHPSVTQEPAVDAPQLLRSVGLLADGPGQWGRPLSAQGPGVFAIELVAPLATPPIELTRVGKWIERVESLRLDGERPTSRALASRIGSFWLGSQTVLYIGSSDVSIARRVAAMAKTELGDRRPYSGGHWLKLLRGLETARVWWSATNATEEYEDALFDAFAVSVSDAERAALPDREVVLPFANVRRGDGRRKATGLTGSLLADAVEDPAPPTTIVNLPDGDADGARGEPAPVKRRTPAQRASRPARPATIASVGAAADSPEAIAAGIEGLTVEGAARLRAELEHLTTVKRREVVARIRTAKEHGDLKENAEYHAAREEQSFLEGRIQALEGRLRTAVIVNAPASGARVGLGSKVTVEIDGETLDYTIVGASESDPAAGRISSSSPVGRALVGRDVGEVITVITPAGAREYRIVQIK